MSKGITALSLNFFFLGGGAQLTRPSRAPEHKIFRPHRLWVPKIASQRVMQHPKHPLFCGTDMSYLPSKYSQDG